MCGIVAVHGRAAVLPAILEGLGRLEYRGYDSTGVALVSDGRRPEVYRAAGRLAALDQVLPPPGAHRIGIGHTRWATHGAPTVGNAHPHRDCRGRVALVHNGVIENAAELRTLLAQAGHVFATEVDTEVIAHLIEDSLGTQVTAEILVRAVAAAVSRLKGSWALAVTAEGVEGIVVARHRSPLLVATGPDCVMASSDPLGFAGEVRDIYELADGELAALGPHGSVRWYSPEAAEVPLPRPLRIPAQHIKVHLAGAEDFTGKEIAEQPEIVQRLIERLDGGIVEDLNLPIPARVRLIACGSSAYAAQVTARVLTHAAGIPAQVITASEHAAHPDEPNTLTIAFSQSGETADVLAARESWGGAWLAVTNNPWSTLARGADAVLDVGCGPELGVAATKSFTAQVVAGTGLALSFAARRRTAGPPQLRRWWADLRGIPDRLAATDIGVRPVAEEIADELVEQLGWIYVSRGAGVPYAFEGALKLKELAYRWTEALPAGEFKHGPIALVTPGVPVIAVCAQPLTKLEANLSELRSRGGRLITVGGHDSTMPVVLPDDEPPWGPLEAVVALQHLARETTRRLGHNVDRPRNLAKSVTVE